MEQKIEKAVKNIERAHGTKIAILGFAREGRSLAAFLPNDPEFHGAEIWVLDSDEKIDVPPGMRSRLGADYLSDLGDFDIIFRTPGIRYNLPEIQDAIKQGVNISSATKLFFERCPGKIVGITGTKGKGTTSTLTYEILKAAGKKVFLAGNIGTPAIDILNKMDKDSIAVLEMSSFQLMDMEKSPHVSVALMVTSEHLNWHANVEEYAAAKANIVRFQSPDDHAVLAEDYPTSISYAKLTKGNVFTFSRRHAVKKGTWVEDGSFWFSDGAAKEQICATETLHLPGEHNWENAAAAITIGKILGVAGETITQAISQFKGLEHRLEFVAEINGARYFNDSYSTAPDATEVAIEAFHEPKILILGGASKESDFAPLGKLISNSKSIKAIIGIGVEWPRIRSHINNPTIKIIEGCDTMAEIVNAAQTAASAGDVVLLSPGCASFGMFKNYTSRGEQFKEAVRQLKKQ